MQRQSLHVEIELVLTECQDGVKVCCSVRLDAVKAQLNFAVQLSYSLLVLQGVKHGTQQGKRHSRPRVRNGGLVIT